jgi:hypothetical protein
MIGRVPQAVRFLQNKGLFFREKPQTAVGEGLADAFVEAERLTLSGPSNLALAVKNRGLEKLLERMVEQDQD